MNRKETLTLIDTIDAFLPGFGSAFAARLRAETGEISETEARSAISFLARRHREEQAKQRAAEMKAALEGYDKEARKRER